MIYANGTMFDGQWEMGRFLDNSGIVIFKYANGDEYTGEWSRLAHGQG
jgi:hypothetical protein